MLGRMRMTIEQCEAEYKSISQRVFGKKNLLTSQQGVAFVVNGAMYDAKPLEDSIKDVVGRVLKNPEAPLFEAGADTAQCRA